MQDAIIVVGVTVCSIGVIIFLFDLVTVVTAFLKHYFERRK